MKTAAHLPEADHRTEWCGMPANGPGIAELRPDRLLPVAACAVSLGESQPIPAKPPPTPGDRPWLSPPTVRPDAPSGAKPS